MKRVLNGVHVLMAVGLIVALAACSSGGNNSGIKQERDQALAAAAQAEIDKMAADAAAAQAEIDKMAADAAAAQAEIDKMAAEAAAAQAEIDKMAAEAAAAQAEIDKMAAEAATAQAEIDKMAAEAAAAQAEIDKMAAEDALAGATKSIPELEAAVMAAKTAHDMASAAKDTADMALKDAMDARMMAQMAVNDPEPDGLGDAIEALQMARDDETAAMETAMMAAKALEAAQTTMDNARDALVAADTGPSAGELTDQATANAREAFGVLALIVDDADVTTRRDDTTRKAMASLVVKYGADGATFSTKGPDRDSESLMSKENKAPAIPDWQSGTLNGKLDGSKSKGDAMVYSNIEAPEEVLFAVEYEGVEVIISSASITSVPDVNTHWKRAKIPAGNSWGGNTAGGTIEGSYHGVDGTFSCTDPCPGPMDFPARRSDDTIIGADTSSTATDRAITGQWTFKPKEKTATIKENDDDFLSFGYWLSKDNTGTPDGFKVFYGGAKPVAATADAGTAVMTLDETVKYEGPAGGKYVTKDDIANTASPGYFTADAVLTADFRDDTVTGITAGTGVGTLEGSISGFKDGDTSPLGNLKLTLKGVLRHGLTTATDVPDGLHVRTGLYDHDADGGTTPMESTNTIDGTAGGAKADVVGSWEAQLFNSDKKTNVPGAVAGAFSANIGNGQATVVGAFGALKVEE